MFRRPNVPDSFKQSVRVYVEDVAYFLQVSTEILNMQILQEATWFRTVQDYMEHSMEMVNL
jgi:hypothetical protein